MVTIGCPFCSKLGTLMVITGLAAIISGVTLTHPILLIGGTILIIIAYIIPSSLGSDSCTTGNCNNPSPKPSGEEKINE